jgi:hypothetical protein
MRQSLDFAFLVLLISALAVSGLAFPGHVMFDAILQIDEGTTGQWVTFNPPVISAIWALLYHTVDSVWPILLVQNLFFFSALWLIVRGPDRFAGWGLMFLVLAAFWPPLVNYQGVIVKDVFYADCSLWGFALLFAAGRGWLQSRAFAALTILMALAVLVLGALTRQQGIFSLLVGLAVAAISLVRLSPDTKLSLGTFFYRLIPAAIWVALVWIGLSSLPAYATGKQPDKDYRVGLYVVMRYDIVGILHFAPDLNMDLFEAGGWDISNLQMLARDHYTGERTDYIDAHLGDNPKRPSSLPPDVPFDLDVRFQSLAKSWINAIHQKPGAYLAHRMESFAWLLGLRDEGKCTPIYVGVPNEPVATREALGIEVPRDLRNSKEFYLLRSLLNTPIYSHWVYLLLLVGELMVLLVTYRKGDEAIIGMGLSAYVMTMSFAVIGLACDFRYLYFPMVASLVIPIMMAGRTRSHEIAKNIPAKIRPTPTA